MRFAIIILSIVLITLLFFLVYKQVKETFTQQDDVLLRLRNRCSKVFPKEMESIQLYTGDKSYTINKEKVYLCMKDENGNYYNDNILTHVLLHELAHTMCHEVGHTDLFQEIFQDLMERAHEQGIYDMDTYIPENYCVY